MVGGCGYNVRTEGMVFQREYIKQRTHQAQMLGRERPRFPISFRRLEGDHSHAGRLFSSFDCSAVFYCANCNIIDGRSGQNGH